MGEEGRPAGSERGLERATVLALVAMGAAVLIIANDFTALAVPPLG